MGSSHSSPSDVLSLFNVVWGGMTVDETSQLSVDLGQLLQGPLYRGHDHPLRSSTRTKTDVFSFEAASALVDVGTPDG